MQKYPILKLNEIDQSFLIEVHQLLTQRIQDNNLESTIFTQINSKFKLQKITHSQAAAIYANLQQKETNKNSTQKKNWKSQELHLLVFLIEKYCSINSIEKLNQLEDSHWQEFSLFILGRTADECKFKILSLTAETITSDPWTQEERNILTQLIQLQSMNWNNISQKLFQRSNRKVFRTSKQCRQHYMCFLKPNLKKGVWTQEQDYKLICLFLQYGKKWSKIMKSLQGRNQNSIKNRFFLLFQNKSRAVNNSDLIRKVKRRKQKLQKSISLDQTNYKPTTSFQTKNNQFYTQKLENLYIKSLKQIQQEVKKECFNSQETKKSLEEQGHSTQENIFGCSLQGRQMEVQADELHRPSCQNINGIFNGFNNNFLCHSLMSEQLIFQSFEQYISF